VDFQVEQVIDADPDAVARAYTDPALYEAIGAAGGLGRAEVVDRQVEGDLVRLQVRYRFTGELSSAARAVLDPQRLTWVEHSEHDLARRHVSYRLVPDHYGDRFRAAGACRIAPGAPPADGAVRTVTGSVKVSALVVGPAVERAIVSGLRDHLAGEVAAVERFLARAG
jgi:hypothetical protein